MAEGTRFGKTGEGPSELGLRLEEGALVSQDRFWPGQPSGPLDPGAEDTSQMLLLAFLRAQGWGWGGGEGGGRS